MPRLTKDQIKVKNKAGLEPIVVEVPDWEGDVLIRPLTLQDINDCNRKATNDVRGGEVNANVRNGWYLVTGLVDPQITLADAEEWLTEAPAGPVSVVLAELLTRSGLTERAKEDAKSVLEAEPAEAIPNQTGGTTGEDAN